MYSGQRAKALFSIMLLPRRTWSFPSSGSLHVCAEQCHCLRINRPGCHPCAAHRAAWVGLTSWCTSQIFRSPRVPPLEVLLRLFSPPGVSGEVNFKSCLNCAGLAGRDAALACYPGRPTKLWPQSALPMRTWEGVLVQRGHWCAPTGLQDFQLQVPVQTHKGHQNQSDHSISRQESISCAQSSPPFEASLARMGGTHAPGGKWQAASAPPKECSKKTGFLWCQRQLVSPVWLRILLCCGSGVSPAPRVTQVPLLAFPAIPR